MFIRKMERASAAAQLFALLVGGLWVCYRGTTFADTSNHPSILPAAMAIIAGLTVIMVVIYCAVLMFMKDQRGV